MTLCETNTPACTLPFLVQNRDSFLSDSSTFYGTESTGLNIPRWIHSCTNKSYKICQ